MRDWRLLPATLLLAACASPPRSMSQADAQVFVADRVLVEASASPEPLAIVVRAGRIVALEKQAPPGARVHRFEGCLMPGLTDAHGHIQNLGELLESQSLRGLPLDEIRRVVRELATKSDGDEWIVARGWDQNLWPGGSLPTAAWLDEAVPGRAVVLERIDGHALWVSGEAMRRAGITSTQLDPGGGEIVRDRDGRPSGVFIDNAEELIERAIPAPTPAVVERRIRRALRALAEVGLTSIHDAGTSPEELAILTALAERGELPIRVASLLLGSGPTSWLDEQYARGPRRLGRDQRLSTIGVKFFVDGALGSRGAWLQADYSDQAGHRGLQVKSPEELERLLRPTIRAGFMPAVHAIGDGGNRLVLDLFARLRPTAPRGLRFRIEHAQIVDPADIPRFRDLGVIASMQPTHATSDMPWVEDRLGANRLAGAYAWRKFLNAGVVVAGGSDVPVESPDPRLGLYAAITRSDAEGHPPGGWLPQEKLTAAEALALFTTGAAYAAGEENERGRIAPGYRADFTVLSECPTTVPAARIPGLSVEATIVGGEEAFAR